MNTSFSHQESEKKWAAFWQKTSLYEPKLEPGTSGDKPPFYNLMMFPYPSAEGLHVGNMYAFTGADVYGRYQRMQGKDVFEPIGLDGFGIHSENYAIKIGKHPADQAKISQENFYRQLGMIGNGFAWNERLETYDPAYYKWTQWLFIQMYNNGLAYKGTAQVNWCPSCKTVLADEQVEGGVCERCKSETSRVEKRSWFFKITEYAERLLKNIETIDWPDKIKTAQRQWIGKKEGIEIEYPLVGVPDKKVVCFTTRPDTNFGATFLVIAPEHPLVEELLAGTYSSIIPRPEETVKSVQKYVTQALNKSEQKRQEDANTKTGVFTGLYAENRLNGKQLPIWISDFVLVNFGTGAVVGVPGHDQRDFAFAQAFDLPVIRVVVGEDGDDLPITRKEQVQEENGKMVNSSFLNGMDIHEATQKMIEYHVEKGWGTKTTSYHLRDWLISRQRYWGAPIPMVTCDTCGWQPIPEDQLPVELPFVKDYTPKGDGGSPLENAPEEWLKTVCPKCGGAATRETDVLDTFLDSSWYFLRYPSLHAKTADTMPFDLAITKKWLPVNAYIGGAEHAVLHLLYSRFVTMALKDWGHLDFEEPFPFLFGHGLIIKDGAKMSKSRGNVVNPDEYIKKFGADTLRTYLMFLGPYDQGGDFRDSGIAGMYRWIQKIWRLFCDEKKYGTETSVQLKRKLHKTIQKCSQDMQKFRFNTSIAFLMECANIWAEEGAVFSKDDALAYLKLLSPFAPFMSEEVYQTLFVKSGDRPSIHVTDWPAFDLSLVTDAEREIPVQINGKLRGSFMVSNDQANDKEFLLAKALETVSVQKYLDGKPPKKTIVIPGKLVNLVV